MASMLYKYIIGMHTYVAMYSTATHNSLYAMQRKSIYCHLICDKQNDLAVEYYYWHYTVLLLAGEKLLFY